MNILIFNIGSSSIKYDFFSQNNNQNNKISSNNQINKQTKLVMKDYIERVVNYESEIKKIIKKLNDKNYTVDAVGHRVVHGGIIKNSCILAKNIINQLDKIKNLAPLHNIPELKGIKICLKLFNVPQVAIFDTAFHHTIPDYAYTYAIPLKFSKKYGIRRYGFHGPSHKYVSLKAAEILKKPLSKLKIITCHLGNGVSVTAINKGESIDTSMGFTPLEGLVMGTRCGDIDPSIVLFLQKKENLRPEQVEHLLNKESGLKGLCGMNDMRDIFKSVKKDSGKNNSRKKEAKLALDIFCYHLTKYIGAYSAVMNGVDAIVFTAGIGENAWWVREEVMKNFAYLDAAIDQKKNKNNAVIISKPSSKVKVLVIKTNEELMMCEEVVNVLSRKH